MNKHSLPDAFFGHVGASLPDWRKDKSLADERDDDEEIKTPSDVVMMLGFDPAAPDKE